MTFKNIAAKKLLKKYETDDVIILAYKMGFDVGTISIEDMKLRCFLISDKQSHVKKIVADELQDRKSVV